MISLISYEKNYRKYILDILFENKGLFDYICFRPASRQYYYKLKKDYNRVLRKELKFEDKSDNYFFEDHQEVFLITQDIEPIQDIGSKIFCDCFIFVDNTNLHKPTSDHWETNGYANARSTMGNSIMHDLRKSGELNKFLWMMWGRTTHIIQELCEDTYKTKDKKFVIDVLTRSTEPFNLGDYGFSYNYLIDPTDYYISHMSLFALNIIFDKNIDRYYDKYFTRPYLKANRGAYLDHIRDYKVSLKKRISRFFKD